jgi:hypothetical protein
LAAAERRRYDGRAGVFPRARELQRISCSDRLTVMCLLSSTLPIHSLTRIEERQQAARRDPRETLLKATHLHNPALDFLAPQLRQSDCQLLVASHISAWFPRCGTT